MVDEDFLLIFLLFLFLVRVMVTDSALLGLLHGLLLLFVPFF
eukprot:CAMPEP_0170550320 /NCGR_PEP_ID=MMETSP0211-20121228/8381_1 /TAXON_ID=311385 /ORGANISM="Pseudokeronopsis sp., Strain OXSARD2" /LENGTH=41 /DNA_ID= /DNA_START= /DNA_END= /DNA_ORIENTATION=